MAQMPPGGQSLQCYFFLVLLLIGNSYASYVLGEIYLIFLFSFFWLYAWVLWCFNNLRGKDATMGREHVERFDSIVPQCYVSSLM